MKRIFSALGKFLGLIVILVTVILAGEWIYSEIQFQVWLSQDERRFDFSGYDTPEELKEALLQKLPIGSSEEEIQAFRLAHGYIYREPSIVRGSLVVGMQMSQQGRGLFGLRHFFFGGLWIVLFEVNPVDHSLEDISIILHGGP
jgi:hypothetical protein